MTAETVSVLVPAYNAESCVGKAIESILAQTVPVLEIIVVDDGSVDGTFDIAAAFGDPVRVIRKPNGGPASARNLAARHARGDWLATLDADDWWFSYKNEIQTACTTWPEIGMSHCLFDHRNDRPPTDLTFQDLWNYNWIGNSSVMLRRSVFERLGGFNEDPKLVSVEDYNLWLRVAHAGIRIRTCSHILAHYSTGIGISSNAERLMRASLFNLDDIASRCHLPLDLVQQKRVETLAHFGRQALHERKLAVARPLLRQALRSRPSLSDSISLAASHLPPPLLNLKRSIDRHAHGISSRWGRHDGEPAIDHEKRRLEVDIAETPFWATATPPPSLLDSRDHHPANTDVLPRPVLLTTIDAEEDFDWSRPFSSGAQSVVSMRSQYKAHQVFARFGVIPTYLVDFPVASQANGKAPLQELLASGLCDIGAQLHPWVTPPFVEKISIRNSFPGNLPLVVEYEKLLRLTTSLQDAFNVQPLIYRAGRCGIGPNTGAILAKLEYQADTSVMPFWNYRHQGGPDFHGMKPAPYWLDSRRTLLELPISASLVGHAAPVGGRVSAPAFSLAAQRSGMTSLLARAGALERIRLSPEGITIDEAKRLVRHMVGTGHKVFVLTYHSPSLEPGNTPYVRTQKDLVRFLDWLTAFYEFFVNEIGGEPATWRMVRNKLAAQAATGNTCPPGT